MQLGFGFFSKAEELFSMDDVEKDFDPNFFKEYAETKWLDRYWSMKAMASNTSVPSITPTISDMPSSITNEFRSTTETNALKSVYAEEWIKYFHEKLNLLPDDYQKIITMKYLQRRKDGKRYEDEFIYPEINVSRTKYYQMKKKALDEFGRMMYRGQE